MRTPTELVTTMAQEKKAGNTAKAQEYLGSLYALTAKKIQSSLTQYFWHFPDAKSIVDMGVTDGLLNVYKNCEKFDSQADAINWIFIICRNAVCANFRKEHVRQKYRDTSVDLEQIVDPFPTPEENLAEQDEWKKLQKVIAALPEKRSETAKRFILKNEKMTEIAEKTGQNINTITARLIRERTAIVEKMNLNHVQRAV